MKEFDFYGQLILISIGLLLAAIMEEMMIAFAGLLMLSTGIWQFTSTIINLLKKRRSHKIFFITNLYIAVGYITLAIIFWYLSKESINSNWEEIFFYILLGLPPTLIFRYWIGISKIYNVGFFKNKNIHEQ